MTVRATKSDMIGNRLTKIFLMGGLILVMAGCGSSLNPKSSIDTLTPTTEIISVTGTQSIQVSPPPGDATQMIPTLLTPSNPRLQELIEMAREDLAQRLSIPANQIHLVEFMEVEWSDSSLDCPQPGMSYLQVMTPGYRILLEANAQVHEYHSNKDAYIVYCEDRMPPIIPKP